MALVTTSPSFLSAEVLRERIRVRLMLAAGISAACFSATLWMTFRSTDWAHWIPSARDAWTALLPLIVVAGCAGAITLSRAVRTRTEESCIAWSALSGMVCFAALQSFRIFTPGWVLPSALEMLDATKRETTRTANEMSGSMPNLGMRPKNSPSALSHRLGHRVIQARRKRPA